MSGLLNVLLATLLNVVIAGSYEAMPASALDLRKAANRASGSARADRAPRPPLSHRAARPKLAFRVAKVLTFDDDERVINNATVLVDDGHIVAVDKSRRVTIPEGYRFIDAPSSWLSPGLIDAHNHTAGGQRDLHDSVYLTNPGLRVLESIRPNNPDLKRARASGVTTVLLIPGSGTNMSGFGAIVRTAGDGLEDSVVKRIGSLKIAQAGNPERYWYEVRRSFMNFNLRNTLDHARAYHDAWTAYEKGESKKKPEFNPMYDDFRDLFERRFVVSVHTQAYQVLMMTVLMLARDYGLRTVLDHCTFDAYKAAPIVLSDDTLYAINGPRQFMFDMTQRKMMGNAQRWWQGGVRKLGLNTDAPVIAEEQLFYQGAMACWYGWEPYPALRGITRVPAEALMIDDQVGSIEVGKSAEFGLWDGDPLDPRSACRYTIVGGRIVYDASEGQEF